ncbi:MAG: hypothetical protein AAGH99_12255 [Planctomycetota bacterium]
MERPAPPSPGYPSPAPAVPTASRVKTWQVLTAIGLGSFLGVVVVCGGGVALTMIYMQQQISSFSNIFTGGFGIVPNLTYTVVAPPNATQNQPFDIELTFENTGTTPMTLYSLQDYSGLTLLRSDPPWQSKNYDEMVYQITLQPNQPQVIKLTLESSIPGTQYLNFDANMDASGLTFAEGYATVTVNPSPTPPTTP